MASTSQGRLTEIFRDMFCPEGQGKQPSLVSQQVQNLALLKKKRAQRDGEVSTDSENSLTWASFAQAVPDSHPTKAFTRSKFDDFLSTVKTIVGTDKSSLELAQAAHVVWRAVTQTSAAAASSSSSSSSSSSASAAKTEVPDKAKLSKAQEALEKYFGPISASLMLRAWEQAHGLLRWRALALESIAKKAQQKGVAVTSSSSASSSPSVSISKGGITINTNKAAASSSSSVGRLKEEWGAHLQLKPLHADYKYQEDLEPDSADEDDSDEWLLEEVEEEEEEEKKEEAYDDKEFAWSDHQYQAPVVQAYDWSWLRKACERFATFTETGEVLLSEEKLAEDVLAILKSNQSDVQIQTSLMDLLGMESFDLLEQLVQHRAELKKAVKPAPEPTQPKKPLNENRPPAHMNRLIGVTIQTQEQKDWDKMQAKKHKKMLKMSQAVDRDPREIVIDEAKLEEQVRSLDFLRRSETQNILRGLPEGTTRTNEKKYEEVYVPPVIPPPAPKSSLVPISEFEDFAQLAFRGMTHLNRIQSKVFNAAYKTNHNLLICAPTGAGKTNIAMMTIVHELQQHIVGGVLQKDNFKIVYVAPMKALAQEVQEKFAERLSPLGIEVKELTGDMQLTKQEIKETQIIVTTPEKWDVMTRKSGDGSLIQQVRLLIFDEVHLLHEERGPVIEVLVARTLRYVESSQQMCRIVGLSATLPNFQDVAVFLGVNPKEGLFHFDASYRPVPLTQYFIGIKEKNTVKRNLDMNEMAYKKAMESAKAGNQVMVFVHSRRETVKLAETFARMASEQGHTQLFSCTEHKAFDMAAARMSKSRNSELKSLFKDGFGVHHAGMLRSDRSLVEKLFSEGLITVLVCTATLAWGVNLPAHTVIIKGTQIYDAKRGGFVELSMLDVMQIFGRAGRPQFDTSGEGVIITAHDKLHHYLSLLTAQLPIESQFIEALPNHLNAEIILGTVTNIHEAISWLTYTYLYTRMLRNPMIYGITYEQLELDPGLNQKRKQLLVDAAKTLMSCRMVKFDVKSGNFYSTDIGRVASHYYIHHESILKYNEMLKPHMEDEEVLHLLACSKEFEQIKVREEEIPELEKLMRKYCPVKVKEGVHTSHGKANILLQTYISQGVLDASTLVSDSYYISQSAGRITRALFEMVLKRGKTFLANRFLAFAKMIDRRIWDFQHPLRQFPALKLPVISKLEESHRTSIDSLAEMDASEIGDITRFPKMGDTILGFVRQIPYLEIEASVQPITRSVLKMDLVLTAAFNWNDRAHGMSQPFWVWVEDSENEVIYHTEYILLGKQKYREPLKLDFTIPISEPAPPQYFVRVVSDRWLGSENLQAISFQHLILPDAYPPNTKLLNLHPLPVTALFNKAAESMYSFTHFNPIQTQVFHACYHTDENILLGAPTGSGKTVVAELAMLRLFAKHPGMKAVYIAPMKALARERIEDWCSARSLAGKLGKKVIELTGDTAPDAIALKEADVLITTPEKWDGVSRNWRSRAYVKQVGLVVIDEIHLIGQDRGPVLETLVSRMRYIASHTASPVRVVGLSTALSNAKDLADWLGIDSVGFFNFPPEFRPVPLQIYVSGFPGQHYCPRMATMNKPTYAAITTHSPTKPVLVFVSSRRQTRLTALDLISYSAADGNPHKWMKMGEEELQFVLAKISDPHLKHMLSFGIGMHHAGLNAKDRTVVEELFVSQKIQVLVCTSTLAWGVNFPAHLVVIKGTEYFDAKTNRYVDMPITDVLQMMGRAGRPQFDQEGKACVMVHEPKKNFYKTFLFSPFPVESSLLTQLHDHLNAEVVGGTIASIQDAIEYLTWTFFFRRLLVNPTYYKLQDTEPATLNRYLIDLVTEKLKELEEAGCLRFNADGTIEPLSNGQIASYYYLKYTTLRMFSHKLHASCDLGDVLNVLSCASEYEEMPVRHNEEKLNAELSDGARLPTIPGLDFDSAFLKVQLLLQAWYGHLALPISDYYTDTKSVLDQAFRIMQAMVDVCAEGGMLATSLKVMTLVQMTTQARWHDDNTIWQLPHVNDQLLGLLWDADIRSVAHLQNAKPDAWKTLASKAGLKPKQISEMATVLGQLPVMNVKVSVDPAKPPSGCGGTAGLIVSLERVNKSKSIRIFSPLTKPKDEAWWLVVGLGEELLALKRVSCQNRAQTKLTVQMPEQSGAHRLDVYLVSDSYLGLDQQHAVEVFLPRAEGESESSTTQQTEGAGSMEGQTQWQ